MIWIIIGIVIATPFVLYVVSNDLLTFADVFWGACDAVGSAIMTAFSAYFRFFKIIGRIYDPMPLFSDRPRRLTLTELERRSLQMERECGLIFDEHGFLLPGYRKEPDHSTFYGISQYPINDARHALSAAQRVEMARNAMVNISQVPPHLLGDVTDELLLRWRLTTNGGSDHISSEQPVDGAGDPSQDDPRLPSPPEHLSRDSGADERDDEANDGEKHD